MWETHGKKTRILTIGPAGEHLVRMAIILSDVSSTSGTPGFGAVMGAKNLKAIAVNGTGGVPVAKPQELLDLAYYYQRLATRKEEEAEPPPRTRQQRHAAGSYLGSKLEEEAKNGSIRAGMSGCFACPVCCGLSIKVKDGSLVGSGDLRCLEMLTHEREQAYYGGKPKGRPAYETWKLADLLGISNVRFWERSWFLTLIDKGILTKENTDLPINKLGSVEFYRELLHKTSYREGIGDLLAEGESRVCNYFGGEAIPIWEKTAQVAGKHGGAGGWNENKLGAIVRLGSTVSGLDGRGLYHHSYDPKKWVHPPGCKCGRCTPLTADEYKAVKMAQDNKWYGSENASDLTKWEYKAPMAKKHIDWRIMTDSLVTCMNNFPLTTSNYTPDKLGDISVERRLYSAVTGIDITEEEWTRTAERIYMLERAILTRHGHTRTEDWFFESIFNENSTWLDKEGLSKTMDEYYTLRGIDVATGLPKRSTLEKLDLKDVADTLENGYKIKLPD
jgi:aldehyde:ferredoxin oxidoreductase